MTYRTLAAAVLGVALGSLLLLFPEAVVRAQLAGRVPPDNDGAYGAESSTRYRRLVQLIGVAVLLGGVYFGVTLL